MKLTDFIYDLPDMQIAKEPIYPRDSSKLLCFKDGKISHKHFYNISEMLPRGAQLIVNNAKVIPARIMCKKETGAEIEIFLLEPAMDYEQVFASTSISTWKVMVGNKKRWKEGQIIQSKNNLCQVNWKSREDNIVEISWQSGESFADVLSEVGHIPIPPYLNRASTQKDQEDYQTTYAKIAGSVAAPTAGLHFTEEVMQNLENKGITPLETTLHVGAGTFKPVDAEEITDHAMHAEQFELRASFIRQLIKHHGPRMAVGTTSLRVLESLYQIGVNIKNKVENPVHVLQEQDSTQSKLSYNESLELVLNYLETHGDCMASTAIFIYPGKEIRSINALITNFHQPGSTLTMLISCIVGQQWKDIYQEALAKNYRFLSYGDSSLLWLKA